MNSGPYGSVLATIRTSPSAPVQEGEAVQSATGLARRGLAAWLSGLAFLRLVAELFGLSVYQLVYQLVYFAGNI